MSLGTIFEKKDSTVTLYMPVVESIPRVAMYVHHESGALSI